MAHFVGYDGAEDEAPVLVDRTGPVAGAGRRDVRQPHQAAFRDVFGADVVSEKARGRV